MSNPSADKGARAERAVVTWLRNVRGFAAERVRSGRSTDAGDVVWPDSPWHLDVKNRARLSIGAWMTEAEAEADDMELQPLVVVRVPGQLDPGKWWAVVRLEDLEL